MVHSKTEITQYATKKLFEVPKIPRDYLLVQHNSLTFSKYVLTLAEMRFLIEAIRNVEVDHDDFKTYSIDINNFIDLIETKHKSEMKRVREFCLTFLSKPLEIPINGKFFYSNWFSSLTYNPENETIAYSFDPKLKPYLLKIGENFTKFDIRILYKIRSTYALRLYMILLSETWKGKTREYIIEVDELKEILQVGDKYPLFGNFKKRVLEIALKYINEAANIHVKLSVFKVGKKINKIKFTITRKDIIEYKDLSALSFKNWKEKIIEIFKGKDLCTGVPEYRSDVIISVSDSGFLVNNSNFQSVTPESAMKIWNWLFSNKEMVGNIEKLKSEKIDLFLDKHITLGHNNGMSITGIIINVEESDTKNKYNIHIKELDSGREGIIKHPMTIEEIEEMIIN